MRHGKAPGAEGRAAGRCRRSGRGWVFVFPLGMYATAGLTLGAVAGVPLLHHVGAAAVWPAAAAWTVTALAMGAAALAPGQSPRSPDRAEVTR